MDSLAKKIDGSRSVVSCCSMYWIVLVVIFNIYASWIVFYEILNDFIVSMHDGNAQETSSNVLWVLELSFSEFLWQLEKEGQVSDDSSFQKTLCPWNKVLCHL